MRKNDESRYFQYRLKTEAWSSKHQPILRQKQMTVTNLNKDNAGLFFNYKDI